MIVGLEGLITHKEPTRCVLKCASGVSYAVSISLGTGAKIERGSRVEFLITQIIREDANLLYGFLDAKEKNMFDMLIKLSGIGASTAMAVCSSLSSESFSRAIFSGDSALLTSVPGIGPQTARRIIAELSDAKFGEFGESEVYKAEAMSALESLGFKRDRISKILLDCVSTNTADLVKEALKKLA